MTIVIEDIAWERALLHVTYRTDEGATLMLFRAKSKRFATLRSRVDGERVEATLNIMQGIGREPLEDGEWIFCRRVPGAEANLAWACTEAPDRVSVAKKMLWDDLPPIRQRKFKRSRVDFSTYPFTDEQIDRDLRERPITTRGIRYTDELIGRFDQLSRVFRYVGGKYACAASLIPSVDVTDYFFVKLAIDYYVKNRRPQTRKFSLRQLEKRAFSLYYQIARRILRPQGDVVLFLKENGEVPTENMAAVRDCLIERGMEQAFPIIERYRNTFKERQNLGSWLKDINAIAKSRFVFIDDYCPVFNFVDPDDATVLTQVWHAGVGFKSVGYARFGIAGSPDPYQSAHRRYDYALVGNEKLRDIYSEVFGIEEGALLATGMPRLDHFLDDEHRGKVQTMLWEKYPWMREGRIIVFAPTFRGAGQTTAYYPYNEYIDYGALWEMCEQTNSYFVFEMHHFIEERPAIPPQYRNRLKDLSSEGLSELLYGADVLVTDYSSCFYDCLLLQKPVVFYVPDKVEYSATRGVQRSVDDMAPGVVCDTFDEFIDVLERAAYQSVAPDSSMIDRCLEHSGSAADRVIDAVLLEKEVPGVRLARDAS
ncbi:glycosyl transferase [Adlercreutzia muris]|uniref:Glycosyl transferase n=1 Tax=Adlercreutzia muris TaxID=1796610 RepID=A0A7C8FVM8_9ACTN|nr:CDP-glycerol glycerophosphotransferase family protein [Adlercreutzia muris]KAB1640714.1 glycosyl transferase [Adlercreutzia muris]